MKKFKKITLGILSLSLAIMFVVVAMGCNFKGQSAYELAVERGYKGTEQQWLESLNGEDGKSVVQFDIYEIYEQFKAENPSVSFDEFLSLYLKVNTSNVQGASNEALRSAVSIFCKFTERKLGKNETYYSAGSGVIYSLDYLSGNGYIITNYHVVYDSNATVKISDEISVYFYGREYDTFGVEATFVGGSATYDIAVLKISNADLSKTAATEAKLGDSYSVVVGQNIIAAGNPSGEGLSVVAGIVSVDSENIEMESITNSAAVTTHRVMRIDAPINGGNSGGGVFDASGRLIGIVNAKTVDSDIEGMCYAIPLSTAVGVADSVIDGFNKKVKLGIVTIVDDARSEYNALKNEISIVETLKVTDVESGSISAGIVKANDILKSVKINDGEELIITRSFHLPDFLFKARTGDTITLKVLRDGKEQSVSVVVVQGKLAEL